MIDVMLPLIAAVQRLKAEAGLSDGPAAGLRTCVHVGGC